MSKSIVLIAPEDFSIASLSQNFAGALVSSGSDPVGNEFFQIQTPDHSYANIYRLKNPEEIREDYSGNLDLDALFRRSVYNKNFYLISFNSRVCLKNLVKAILQMSGPKKHSYWVDNGYNMVINGKDIIKNMDVKDDWLQISDSGQI